MKSFLFILLLLNISSVAFARNIFSFLAEPIWTIRGTLEVIAVDDFENKNGTLKYYLREENSEGRIPLQLSPSVPLLSGSKLEIERHFQGINGSNIFVPSDNWQQFQVLAQAPRIQSKGNINIIVMIIHFSNTDNTCTPDEAYQYTFGNAQYRDSTKAVYYEASFGQAQLEGRVAGPFVIDYLSTECNTEEWARTVDNYN